MLELCSMNSASTKHLPTSHFVCGNLVVKPFIQISPVFFCLRLRPVQDFTHGGLKPFSSGTSFPAFAVQSLGYLGCIHRCCVQGQHAFQCFAFRHRRSEWFPAFAASSPRFHSLACAAQLQDCHLAFVF